jgi:GTP-binding protein Era
MPYQSGFVNIIGKPNAGKSSLMNALLGERLSIITPKAQTTRHRIIGILNDPDYQVVFSDTPGIIKDPVYKLQESMNAFIEGSFDDADVFLYVFDILDTPRIEDVPDKVLLSEVPIILVLNKLDQADQKTLETKALLWSELLPKAILVPVSASQKFNLDTLLKAILSKLPQGKPYFEQDALTDRNERFFVTEIIREKILLNYQKEIPYSTEVVVDDFKEESTITKIRATIYVMRDSQKGIIIGHQGSAVKKVSTEARLDIEKFLGKKVYLELQVKVSKDWRDNEKLLKRFGYLH